jgi:hypothetical protein
MNGKAFKHTEAEISVLTGMIDRGELALPDLQRPFIWEDRKVRDLFDSMYQGFPIGYFLLWENERPEKIKHIGSKEKMHDPKFLILDGQQRLTGLYAVFKGEKVMDVNFKMRQICIAFNPLTNDFKVVDASTERNKEYIANITEVFSQGTHGFITNYFKQLEEYQVTLRLRKDKILEKIKEGKKLNSKDVELIISKLRQSNNLSEVQLSLLEKLEDEATLESQDFLIIKDILVVEETFDRREIGERIERLSNLQNYPYQALELRSDLDEEKVAEIFTRINSAGKTLQQTDFILTLISVYCEEGRKEIEVFCRQTKFASEEKASPYNYVYQPDPSAIVRVIAGIGFKRGRMRDAYLVLKGRDLSTRKFSEELREKQFEIFKKSQELVLDLNSWHGFIKILIGLGYKAKELISSEMTVTSAYVFYLIAKNEYGMKHRELDETIGKWFFMSLLTGRYTTSPESQLESDLNMIRDVRNKEELRELLEREINKNFTADFWTVTLPKDLLFTSSSNSPAGNAFFAALIRENDRVLFSMRRVGDLFDPTLNQKKKPLERHHLFPKNYLLNNNVPKISMRNQIANMTYLEFEDNIEISDASPKEYMKYARGLFAGKEIELERMLAAHCIPKDFEDLEYEDFLEKRRLLISEKIKKTFESL